MVSNGPRYRWTRDDWSGVTTNEFVMNLGHPWGWFTVQHLCLFQIMRRESKSQECKHNARVIGFKPENVGIWPKDT